MENPSKLFFFFFPCLCLLLQEQKRKSQVLGTGWDFALRWILVLNYITSDRLLPCSSASKKHEAAKGVYTLECVSVRDCMFVFGPTPSMVRAKTY